MLHLLPTIRFFTYITFALWCFLTFVISAAYIGTTNKDFGVYSNGAALLLASSLLGFGLLGLHFFVHRRGTNGVIASLAVETGVVALLWVLFLAGSADLSSNSATGSFCNGFNFCRLGSATQAFGWLSWITLTVLLINLVITGFTGTRSKTHGTDAAAAHVDAGITNANKTGRAADAWMAPYGGTANVSAGTRHTKEAPVDIGAAPAQHQQHTMNQV